VDLRDAARTVAALTAHLTGEQELRRSLTKGQETRSFMLESPTLFQMGRADQAAVNLVGQVLLGLAAFEPTDRVQRPSPCQRA
jgi:hypothetical protein